MNVTCYRHEPGCGYNGEQEMVNDVSEMVNDALEMVNDVLEMVNDVSATANDVSKTVNDVSEMVNDASEILDDALGMVNGALETVITNHRFVNPSEGEGSASWISQNREVVANANQTDDAASGVETDFSRMTAFDPDPRAWGCDSCSCSCLESYLGSVPGVLGVDLHFVSDSRSGRGRNLASDRLPWALREEGEEAFPLLGLLVPCASYPPRDASVCPSPSSPPPTSPFEFVTAPAPPRTSSPAQPSQRSASVCFLPAFRGRRPRPQRSLGVGFRAQRPCGSIPPALRRPDRACHGP